ncbi:DNA/RNA helicase, superfamily II (plasmid) [Cylindrospermum stagnale PCC 7417]|uniref:DNA/RNA helicase, superfamily II n=1 Tax=Cylindrospermum stagnale PCC 7417 TaxID=56107 RepID=K9X885_9NOST|nr:plasmid replication protein, CyRepA1 family [Cylindrospermum stagnale]AFZ28286.1 DNA/RNA helicase, superfamily II [Cylindrospermum stagnale PCC 7417]
MLTNNQLTYSTPEIAQPHWDEWLSSAIDPELITANLRSLWGTTPYEYLLYSPKISRRNDGRLRDGDLRNYRHIEHGGWWCNGIDPLNNYQPMPWGCFKPDKPRRNKQKIHKIIKYEHPYKEATRAFFPYVTEKIWAKISNRCGIPITEEDRQNPGGFWHWVWLHNVPVIIVEGVKKAAALLSAGYVAIALPGVNGGYRTPKDEDDNAIGKPYLIPEIKHFASLGRQVNICFDHDSKAETRQRVRTAINRMGRLLIGAGCEVRVIDLPAGAEKGVDDFIAALGQDAFHALYNTAEALSMWQIRLSTLLTYPPAIALNQRFLGQILIPAGEKLIVLKAPKGTGKTEWLASVVARAHDQGQRVLVITHRIQLGEALCNRFGVNYVTEIHDSEIGDLLGYGVCIDSLHTESQAKFNPNDWSNDIVIIDEADQVFWHLLNSGTEVSKRRVAVLDNLKKLVQNVLSSPQGKIYLSSADLSDADVNYIRSLAGGIHINPFVILNNYQPQSGNCYNYQGNDPRNVIAALDKAMALDGGHHLLCCSAQKAKSKWGTQALEARYRRKFPHLRILRIDSVSVADPSHPAYGCIAHLNEILTEYDLVIASPSLETGVSIDIKSHFSAVWGVFQGVQAVNSVRQMLARLRENVDRHIWVRKQGLGVIGNGSTSMGVLLASQHAATRANIALLSAADNADYSYIDENFQPESLQTWAKRACVINAQTKCYRDSVLQGLADDGYTIIDADSLKLDSKETEQVFNEVQNAAEELHTTQCEEIATAEKLSDAELKKLSEKRAKTKSERQQERKADISQRYGVEVTPEIVRKDDSGWYLQLRLHYYLNLGRKFLVARDASKAKAQVEKGNNAIWKPDFNRGQMLPAVLLLEKLNVSQLFNAEVEFRSSDVELQKLRSLAVEHKQVIKNYLGVSISEKDSAIAICQKFLKKLGMKLSYLGRFGTRENRERVYKFIPPQDEREAIFLAWLGRDEATSASTKENMVDAPNVSTPNNKR